MVAHWLTATGLTGTFEENRAIVNVTANACDVIMSAVKRASLQAH